MRDTMYRMAWRLRAACRGHPRWSWWFAEVAIDPASLERTAWARSVCATCPVRMECYTVAVEHHERNGVWGGVIFPGEWNAVQRIRLKAEAVHADTTGPDAVPDVRSA